MFSVLNYHHFLKEFVEDPAIHLMTLVPGGDFDMDASGVYERMLNIHKRLSLID